MKQNLLLLTTEQETKFTTFIEEFSLWNKTHNLMSKGDSTDLWERHIYESVLLAQFFPKDAPILDIGSGNGFPGLILPLLGLTPHMCEIISKKASFLKYMLHHLHLPGKVLNEDVFGLKQRYAYFCARGFSALKNLLKVQHELSESRQHEDAQLLNVEEILVNKGHDFSKKIKNSNLLKSSAYGVYLKGPSFKDEIDDAKKVFSFDYLVFSVSEKNHIVVTFNVSPLLF